MLPLAGAESGHTVLQVGDFGVWPSTKQYWQKPSRPVYFIDGNHEGFKQLNPDAPHPYEVWPGLIHIPRGVSVELEGHKILCLGGGTSLDRKYRQNGRDWFPQENITNQQVDDAIRVGRAGLDFMVTHCAPQVAVEAFNKEFGTGALLAFMFPEDWKDPNALQVQKVWDALDRPPLICGHYHRSFQWESVKILAENEVFNVPSAPL